MQDKPACNMNPIVCADLGDGYIQNRLGVHHRASSRVLPFSRGETACFILENPEDSGTLMLIAALHFVNLSAAPMRVSVYCPCPPIRGIAQADAVAPKKRAAQLLSGLNLAPDARPDWTLSAGPYETRADDIRGGISLLPGTLLLAAVTPLSENPGQTALSAAWWEESV